MTIPTWMPLSFVGLVLLVLIGLLLFGFSARPAVLPAPETSSEDMVPVPAGEFIMGTGRGGTDEGPPREVYLDPFLIDKYEVTSGAYVAFLNELGGHLSRCGGYDCVSTKDQDPDSHILIRRGRYVPEEGYEQHPASDVSWYGAVTYCEARGKRLPTEAEWEKAARGTVGSKYPWGDQFENGRANVGYAVGETTPVGSYPLGVSPYGVHDMAGNVWEWVDDWYGPYPETAHASDFYGKYKVVRGGSWNHPPRDARATYRDIAHPARRIHVVGFRCAR